MKYLTLPLLWLLIQNSLSLNTNTNFLSGSIDIIVVEHNGILKSTPFYVRFGIFLTLNPVNTPVIVTVNDRVIPLEMRLTQDGDGYFSESSEKFIPTEQDLKALELKPGKNKITFQIKSCLLNKEQSLSSFIYLFNSNTKLVVSDIDGTITRSNVLGLILPLFGIDWSQSHINKLYRDIENNGYQMVYLTARAIGETQITRDYIYSLKQGI